MVRVSHGSVTNNDAIFHSALSSDYLHKCDRREHFGLVPTLSGLKSQIIIHTPSAAFGRSVFSYRHAHTTNGRVVGVSSYRHLFDWSFGAVFFRYLVSFWISKK